MKKGKIFIFASAITFVMTAPIILADSTDENLKNREDVSDRKDREDVSDRKDWEDVSDRKDRKNWEDRSNK